MRRDQTTRALKLFVKVVGLLLLISILYILIFESNGMRPLGYLLFAVPAFFAWRMARYWSKSIIQVYALTQTIATAIALGEIGNLIWPQTGRIIGGFVVIIFGSAFERFLLRYTGFSDASMKHAVRKNSDTDVAGTPWQADPGYTTH